MIGQYLFNFGLKRILSYIRYRLHLFHCRCPLVPACCARLDILMGNAAKSKYQFIPPPAPLNSSSSSWSINKDGVAHALKSGYFVDGHTLCTFLPFLTHTLQGFLLAGTNTVCQYVFANCASLAIKYGPSNK